MADSIETWKTLDMVFRIFPLFEPCNNSTACIGMIEDKALLATDHSCIQREGV
jgi:hypothetical protein